MKNIMIATLLVGTSLMAGQVFASEMQCQVNSFTNNYFTSGYCSNEGNNRTTTAAFRVKESKEISNIIWTGESSNECSGSAVNCIVDIRHGLKKSVGATVLYSDGTWESLPAITASYEGFF